MNKNTKSTLEYKIVFWCEIALSIITVLLAVLFITQIADIYYSGSDGDIYSRAIVGARLKKLIAPIVIWIVAIIGCYILSVVFKINNEVKTKTDNASVIKRLKKRMPTTPPIGLEKEYKTFKSIEYAKFVLYTVCSVFALGTAVFAIVYLANVANFSNNVNASILNLVKYVFSFIGASFLLFTIGVIFNKALEKRELDCIKKVVAKSKDMPKINCPIVNKFEAIKTFCEKKTNKVILVTRIVVLIAALTFIGLGIWNEGFRDTLYKAINICTECIGLG